jgi:hypothetical protein
VDLALRTRTWVAGLALACSTMMLATGCGGGLDGSSTCAEFMNASQGEQDQVINSLAAKYRKPDYTSPLGRPAVPYYCATHPKVTLGQFFAGAS